MRNAASPTHNFILGWDSSSSPCVLTHPKYAICVPGFLNSFLGWTPLSPLKVPYVRPFHFSFINSLQSGNLLFSFPKKRQSRRPLNSVCSCSFAELAQTLWPGERTRGCWPRAPRRTGPRWRTELRTTPFAAASHTRREGT